MGWFAETFVGTPPEGLVEWAERQRSARAAWERCERADWLIWMAAKLPDLTEDSQHRVVVAAAAPLLPPRWRDAFSPMPRDVDIAVAWALATPGLQAADLVAAFNLAALAALLSFPWLGVAALGVLVGTGVALAAIRRAVVGSRIARMTFHDALVAVLVATTRGVARAGPRERAAQAQLVRESLPFVRRRLE